MTGTDPTLSELQEFLQWKAARDKAAAERDDFDVPLFEKTKDGTERSVTLPYSRVRGLLAEWWPQLAAQLEGGQDGDKDGGQGASGQGTQGTSGAARTVANLFGSGQAGKAGKTRQGQG